MDGSFTLAMALGVGFSHAFEVDHLVAVGNLITKRDRLIHSVKDGMYWGLGHTSTILIIGAIFIIGKTLIDAEVFSILEAMVGLMLVLLGLWRLFLLRKDQVHQVSNEHQHKLAYGVGLIHGLAGSGTLLFFVLGQMSTGFQGMLFLILFGVGSIVGMIVASGVFSIPFTKKYLDSKQLKFWLSLLTAIMCIGVGLLIIYENLRS